MTIPDDHPFTEVVSLPRDDQSDAPREPTAHGALHWAPHHDAGFQARMDAIARWVADARPRALVIDVSVEVATFVRLLGIPVVVMALPGKRYDAAHLLVHRLADHIIAAWPQALYDPSWLRPHAHKTSYVGGISRFDGRPGALTAASDGADPRVLVIGGASADFGQQIDDCALACPGTTWTAIGGATGHWVKDPWPQLCAADVVVTNAGQGAVADVAAARRRAIVIPAATPVRRTDRHRRCPTPAPAGDRDRRLAGCPSVAWTDRPRAGRRSRLLATLAGVGRCAARRVGDRGHRVVQGDGGCALRTAVITTVRGRGPHLRRQLPGIVA